MKIEHQIWLLTILSISVLGGITSTISSVSAQDKADTKLEFLLIQHAESSSISRVSPTTYSLQLDNVSDRIVLFSDRPNRIVATQSIQDFIGNWTAGQDSFEADPPNAALVIIEEDNKKEDIFEVELLNPTYDKDEKILRYDITFLGNTSFAVLPYKLGKSVLVIDDTSYDITIINKSGENDNIDVFQKDPNKNCNK
jgi:hypothetical protein